MTLTSGDAMSFDSTMKFSNTMNRAEIEAMLGECRAFAEIGRAHV